MVSQVNFDVRDELVIEDLGLVLIVCCLPVFICLSIGYYSTLSTLSYSYLLFLFTTYYPPLTYLTNLPIPVRLKLVSNLS